MAIKQTYLIEKRNALNEMKTNNIPLNESKSNNMPLNELRSNNMSLQELRFFSIYLSKINSRDVNTRIVRFPLDDFRKIIGLGRLRINYLKAITNNLLSKIVNIPLEKSGYTGFQLFKECTISQDDNTEWYIEIDAHDKALPLMFEFKEKYFSYQLWNALRLKSSNQLRMYEILKQYEKIGERTITVVELKELLGIDSKEYPRYNDFKVKVLESCKKALEENTDIKFTYEPTGKKGKGGKIIKLKFKIYKNNDYADPLSLDEFISQPEDETVVKVYDDERLDFVAGACNEEFTESEMRVLYDLIIQKIPYSSKKDMQFEYFHYLQLKYDELNMKAERAKINNRFGYLKKLIEIDL